MTITPQSKIFLCETPLENDYKNQLTFENAQAQKNYFATTKKFQFEDFTYVKKDSVIYVNENIDKIINCNYLYYTNVGFTTKTYYCFITGMNYENENCTAITFETDVFQTWQFDIFYHPCFVEREHVNNDTIGLHTVPENIETGEYIHNSVAKYGLMNSPTDLAVIISSTIDFFKYSDENERYPKSSKVNGIFSGSQYFIFKEKHHGILDPDPASYFLEISAQAGQTSAIQGIFLAPKLMIDYDNIDWESPQSGLQNIFYKPIVNSQTPYNFENFVVLKNNENINGYIPKNNKLFCYPYNFLTVYNNSGTMGEFHYEDFSGYNCDFSLSGVITPGCSIKLTPLYYKNINNCQDESIMCGKFPICNYINDTYINWLTQNSVNINGMNIPLTVAKSLPSFVGKSLQGRTSGIVDLGESILSSIFEQYEHSFMSPQLQGNLNSGDVNASTGNIDFFAYNVCIKSEYAKIIDDYFSMFGYKVNSLKLPNITGRQNWNYVKTIGCNISGNIPQEDVDTLKKMFDSGVTLWHNTNTIYNYNSSNNIV